MVKPGFVIFARDSHRLAAFYVSVAGLAEVGRDDSHVALESASLQVVIHAIRTQLTSPNEASSSFVRRESAAIKPVFVVDSLRETRSRAAALGGSLDSADLEWGFRDTRVCDGVDPEGNVIQFREQAG